MAVLRLSRRVVDLETGRIEGGGELRPMELRVLRRLAEKPGDALGADELLRTVWGYAAGARSRTVYSTVHRLRLALEDDPSSPRHVLTVRNRGFKLVDISSEGPTLDMDGAAPTPPPDPRSFVGRQAELSLLQPLVAEPPTSRLVTLLGPGGAGKSRLAREFAWITRDRWPGGAWFVDLSAVSTAEGAAGAVATALRLPWGGSAADLGARLSQRGPTLVVLDNFETLQDDAAELAGRWLEAADALRVLVTSRRALGIPAEQRVPIAGLPLADATALLLDRARAVAPAFAASEREIAALVAAVDALPLAIEIAASRAAALSTAAVLDELAARGDLINPRVDGPERHRTLHAVVEWSWDGLPGWGRAALVQLSEFVVSFTLAGARAVLSLPPDAPGPLEVVTLLVERGLVTPTSDTPQRYRLYAAVRAFVAGRPGDVGAWRRYVAYFAAQATERLGSSHGVLPFDEAGLAPEIDDALRAARGALTDGMPRGELLPYACALAVSRGQHHPTGRRLLERALAAELDPTERVPLRILATRYGAGRRPTTAFDGLAAEAAEAGLPALAAWVEADLAHRHTVRSELDLADQALDRCAAWLDAVRGGPGGPAAWAVGVLEGELASRRGQVLHMRGQRGARALLDQAIRRFDAVGLPARAARLRLQLADTLDDEGRASEAERYLDAALPDLPMRLPAVSGRAAIVRCSLDVAAGRFEAALAAADRGVRIFTDTGSWFNLANALVVRARAQLALGRSDAARADVARALDLARQEHNPGAAEAAELIGARLDAQAGDPHGEARLRRLLGSPSRATQLGASQAIADLLVGRGQAGEAIRELAQLPVAGPALGMFELRLVLLRVEVRWAAGDRAAAADEIGIDVALEGDLGAVLRFARAAITAELEAPRSAGERPCEAGRATIADPPPGPWGRVWHARLLRALGEPERATRAVAEVVAGAGDGLLAAALADLRGIPSAP
jgi:predicted ATPase/DNA-binding winged helix-turn-helix (wHTH) protein